MYTVPSIDTINTNNTKKNKWRTGKPRRTLALPHRAMRTSSVKTSHAIIGVVALILTAVAMFFLYPVIWKWQINIWADMAVKLGVTTNLDGFNFGWDQYFFIADWWHVLILGLILFLGTWIILKSSIGPSFKSVFIMLTWPLFLYCLVVFMRGAAPSEALSHVGPEWLYGEIYLWCLIPLLYSIFIFPLPFSMTGKLLSLLTVLAMSIAWRTTAPLIYLFITLHTKGLLAIPAWMALGPWADYIYIVPMFSVTLYLYKGGKQDDFRT